MTSSFSDGAPSASDVAVREVRSSAANAAAIGYQKQFMEAKKQLEEERERLQKRVQELDELINNEKEILMKKNVPVEQMLKYLGYEQLTREMLGEYVRGIYVYDDGRVEVEWKALKLER